LVDVAARTGSVDSVNTDAQSTATSMDFLISGFLVSIVTRDPNAHLDHCGYVPIEIDLKQHVQVVNVSKRDGCVQLKNMNPPINRLTKARSLSLTRRKNTLSLRAFARNRYFAWHRRGIGIYEF
jgi:hypothetical protein